LGSALYPAGQRKDTAKKIEMILKRYFTILSCLL